MALVLLATACTGGPGTADRASALQFKAAVLTDLMAGNHWAVVRQDFDATLQSARGPMKSRITFTASGKVAGLFIAVPEAP